MSDVKAKNPSEPEFHQAVEEVLISLSLVLEWYPGFRSMKILERMIEPERVITFRVPWMVGYFTINTFSKIGFINWDWLSNQSSVEEMEFTRHLYFQQPLCIRINGHKNKGVITKPGI